MKAIRVLFGLHILALLFGLGGLLIALPHPELWAGSATAQQVFVFGMSHGGALHILFGAATMLAFGVYAIGWRRTLIFFVVGTVLPLSAELTGTATGWPFGGYSYTDGLGVKVAGRVPYSVPLSWFYMGFASFLLAGIVVQAWRGRRFAWLPVVLGAWLLMAWDLVLDPAMANPSMPVRFWTWHESGAYFGMPPRNLVGWFGTGLAFMALSRLLWRGMPDLTRVPTWLPFGVYLANALWAVALAVSVGLWLAALAALVLGLAHPSGAGLAPQVTIGRERRRGSRRLTGPLMTPLECGATWFLRAGAQALAARRLDLRVEGWEYLPHAGPLLIASHHHHHLYDGCALLAVVPRPIHLLVALDWVATPRDRRLMEWACNTARWPVVLRAETLQPSGAPRHGAYGTEESGRYLRRAVRDSVALLRAGRAVVIFPEAYPVVDPHATPKISGGAFLPFRPGVIRLVELAQRDGRTRIPIVPAGLSYHPVSDPADPGLRWQATLRFAAPLYIEGRDDRARVLRAVEEQVRLLSMPVPSCRDEAEHEREEGAI